MKDQKESLLNDKKTEVPKLEKVHVQSKPRELPQQKPKEEKKTEEKKRENPKRPEPRPKPESSKTPEEILGFRPGEKVTQSELKKRYFDLLKQNHPDRVASMGPDFKKLAEKNTKELNEAYEKLKSKAA